MRAQEFLTEAYDTGVFRMAKLQKDGRVVRILKHKDQVSFSDEQGWLLIDVTPGRQRPETMKWIPDTTKFDWVREFNSAEQIDEYREAKSKRAHRDGIDLEAWKDGLYFQINATSHGRDLGRVVFDVQFQGKDTILVAKDLMIEPEYRGQGIAAIMYDYAKELGYVVERSAEQTDAGRAFWDKNRGEEGRVWESKTQTATAKQVLAYINQTHHEPMTAKLTTAVKAHPRWELQQVSLRNLNIPDQDYEDLEQEPESDPYGRVMAVDPDHASEYSTQVIDQHPIVIDDQGYIIDGNHRAWAAAELLNRDRIQAWVPVKQDMAENFADGKKPGRKGLSKRVGIPKKASLSQLQKIASSSTGERRRMAQWQLNMRRGKAKKNK
jgi:GNAT superfamily N-acetyltransferase